MPIMDYREYMEPELGKGRVSAMNGIRTESAAAAGDIEWGAAVSLNPTNPNQIKQFDGTQPFYGIAIANLFAEYRESDVSQLISAHYSANDAVSLLRRGRIYVEVLEDVIKGQGAVVDNTTGNFRPQGTATATVSSVVGSFKTTAQAGNLAEVEINLP